MMYNCPVCGYDRLTDPPRDFTICPSCGTEFEYDDALATHAELRAKWLRNGAQWWSPVDPCPDNWDPYLQVDAVQSALWHLLRESISIQQRAATLATFTFPSYGQPHDPSPDPLSINPTQTLTPQAA